MVCITFSGQTFRGRPTTNQARFGMACVLTSPTSLQCLQATSARYGSPSPVFVSVVHVEASIQCSLLNGAFPLGALPDLVSPEKDRVAEQRDKARRQSHSKHCRYCDLPIPPVFPVELAGVLTSEGPAC